MAENLIFKYGKVVSVSDEMDGGRIRVLIKGVDSSDYTNIKDIPYAFPMLPKLLFIQPKVGETVLVFAQDGSFAHDRLWMGPVISQPHKLAYDSITAEAFLKGGLIGPEIAPSTIPENRGLQPNNDDVSLAGRGSADIIIKPNEIRFRAGKSFDLKQLNKINPSYIQVKHDTVTDRGQINIVSNDINILSHDSINKFNLSDPDDLITDEEFKKIILEAHKLPFGDILIKYLELKEKAFMTHVHAYPGLPPDEEQIEIKNMLSFDMNTLLSNNIRIN